LPFQFFLKQVIIIYHINNRYNKEDTIESIFREARKNIKDIVFLRQSDLYLDIDKIMDYDCSNLFFHLIILFELTKEGYKFEDNSTLKKAYDDFKSAIDKLSYSEKELEEMARLKKGVYSRAFEEKHKHEN